MIYNYSLLSYGRVYNPFNWYYNPLYVVNRIYYIIGGKAFYKYNTPLKPGHIYIFKSLPEFRVHQDKHDPVDHVFFDFITYNGFINKEYIEIGPCPQDDKLTFVYVQYNHIPYKILYTKRKGK